MKANQQRSIMPQTLFDKIWDAHRVARRADGRDLIYIDRHVLHELHAPHAFEQLATRAHYGLVQLEWRNAEGQQAADFLLAIVDIGGNAGATQAIGTSQPGRPGTHDGDPLAGLAHRGKIRAPSLA